MTNWKTTLAGTLLASGQALMHLGEGRGSWWVGLVLTILGGGGLGAFSKDHNVTGNPADWKDNASGQSK